MRRNPAERDRACRAFPDKPPRSKRDPGQADRAMTDDSDAPVQTMWAGKYISVLKRGRWEYVSRTGNINGVVILAEHDGKVILIEQYRVPVGARCLELPAGLVGDEDEHATV